MGRPSLYTEALGVEIASRSAEGKSLKSICDDPAMPGLRMIMEWRHAHMEFDQLLMRAHLAKADLLFEQSIEIADEPWKTAPRLRVSAPGYRRSSGPQRV